MRSNPVGLLGQLFNSVFLIIISNGACIQIVKIILIWCLTETHCFVSKQYNLYSKTFAVNVFDSLHMLAVRVIMSNLPIFPILVVLNTSCIWSTNSDLRRRFTRSNCNCVYLHFPSCSWLTKVSELYCESKT